MTDPLKQIRRLTQALILSGGLNILLLALVLYGVFADGFLRWRHDLVSQRWPRAEEVVLDVQSRDQAIDQLLTMPFDQLVGTLSSKRRLDNTLSERELALGCLTTFYYFNLPQALSLNEIPPPKPVELHGVTMDIYPGLTDEQFSRIEHFAEVERWPLTTQGLFVALKGGQDTDKSLTEAFWQTPEFLAVQRLFARSNYPVDRTALLKIVLQGDWETFQQPTTVERFLAAYAVPEEQITPPPPAEPPKEILYVVQDGDSLWKISRRLKVSIDSIKETNNLQSDVLRPGKVLKIPNE